MVKNIKRVDKAGSFYTTFIFERDPDQNGIIESAEIIVPANQADDFQTAIEGATWNQINIIYNRDGITVIK